MTQTSELSATPLLVTVESTHGSLDLEMPGDIAIGKLLPLLITHPLLASGNDPRSAEQWTIGLKGGQKFDPANTLHNYDVLEGAILQLGPSGEWREPLPAIEEELVLPNENRLLVLKNATSKLSSLFKRSR